VAPGQQKELQVGCQFFITMMIKDIAKMVEEGRIRVLPGG